MKFIRKNVYAIREIYHARLRDLKKGGEVAKVKGEILCVANSLLTAHVYCEELAEKKAADMSKLIGAMEIDVGGFLSVGPTVISGTTQEPFVSYEVIVLDMVELK